MGNVGNARMGRATVTFKSNDLGHTLGGVSFTKQDKFEDLKVDEYGDTAIDKALTGQTVLVKTRLAEITLANFAVGMPADSYSTGINGSRVEFGAQAGKLLKSVSGLLRLHPFELASSDKSKDVVIYLAAVTELGENKYTVNEQQYIDVTFTGIIDESKAIGDRLGHIGVDSVS